jgi:glycosyltransferase involved in cell wall biosynthesis
MALSMRIGVNLIPLRPKQMGGHEFYVQSIVAHLLSAETKHRFFLFTAWWNHEALVFPPGRYRKILAVPAPQDADTVMPREVNGLGHLEGLFSLRLMRRWAANSPSDLHDWVRRLRLDLWFCPMTNLEPRQLAIPTVITIPDIQQEYYPGFFTPTELKWRGLMFKPSCEDATAVIAVSNFSKQCMIEKYDLPHEKVHCVYEAGVERRLDAANDPTWAAIQEKYRVPPGYAFFPANMWPHKNHAVLVLAWHRLRQAYGVTLPLLLTGDDLGQWPMLQELAGHFHLGEQVRYLGYVGPAELRSLYTRATMLVFPSLFEGFGLPLLEAMTLGCPVAASNLTSIPEVVGDAALLFDPRAPDGIAEAVYRLLSDETLRQSLIARGHERVALFSWKRAALETLQVFEWAQSQRPPIRPPSRAQRSRIDGIYSDGWATRRVRLYLPYLPEVNAVEIRGFSHHLACPSSISMKVNGRQAHTLSLVDPGEFAFTAELQEPRLAQSGIEIEFLAEADFVPAKVADSLDTRKLAYWIEKLSLICGDGTDIPLYRPPSRP